MTTFTKILLVDPSFPNVFTVKCVEEMKATMKSLIQLNFRLCDLVPADGCCVLTLHFNLVAVITGHISRTDMSEK